MDEDDDFFDMRRRIRIPDKKEKRKKAGSNSDSNSDSSSSDEESEHEIPIPRSRQTSNDKRKVSTAPKNKKRKVIALTSDEGSDDQEQEKSSRQATLTPPPLLAPEAIKQAMALINDHIKPLRRTRRQTNASADDDPRSEAEDSDDDGFDLKAYQSAMDSDIAKQAQRAQRLQASTTTCDEPTKILLLFQGQKRGGEDLPESWETVLGLKVLSTTTFAKMQERFQMSRNYTGDVVFAWRGVRLWHGGTPQHLQMGDQERIDVFTEQGWKIFEEEKRTQESRKDMINLSSDEEKPKAQISLILQGAKGKIKVRVLETVTVRKLAIVYLRQTKLSPTAKITLSQDGDTLDEDETVKTLSLEDDDLLDVQVED